MFSIKVSQEYQGFDTWAENYTLLDSDGKELHNFGWDKPRAYEVLNGLNSGTFSITEILVEKATRAVSFDIDKEGKIHLISLSESLVDDNYPQDFTIEIDGNRIYPPNDDKTNGA